MPFVIIASAPHFCLCVCVCVCVCGKIAYVAIMCATPGTTDFFYLVCRLSLKNKHF